MSRVRVHNFGISIDGFGTGEGQSLETPFGHGFGVMKWLVGTRTMQRMQGKSGGSDGIDNAFASRWAEGIGAEIMGRNKFGHQRGAWTDEDWKGWRGANPPFHTPVFVLTHHPRPSIAMEGGTTCFGHGEAQFFRRRRPFWDARQTMNFLAAAKSPLRPLPLRSMLPSPPNLRRRSNMANQSTRIFNRTEIDASKVAASQTTPWQVIMKNIPSLSWREATLLIRLHAIRAALSAGTLITFGVFGAAPTEEDPTEEYWTATASGVISPLFQIQLTSSLPVSTASTPPFILTANNGTFTGTTPNGGFLPFPAFLTIAQQITASAAPTGDVLVSGDLILKD